MNNKREKQYEELRKKESKISSGVFKNLHHYG